LPLHFVWTHDVGKRVHGGSKATLDSYEIAKRAGWMEFDTSLKGQGFRRLVSYFAQIIRVLLVRRDSVFLVQLPAYGPANIILANLLVRLFKSKILLHDIDRLKRPKPFSTEDLYKHADEIIYTGKLIDYLEASVVDCKCSSRLEMWDYLVDPEFQLPQFEPAGRILFAGNLANDTVGWIYTSQISRPPLDLYGNRCVVYDLGHRGDRYGGPFDADNPIFHRPVGWGLVWTGAKSGGDVSDFDYEMICQSHKFSLYMACGLPVIVWDRAYIANIVQHYECGILISDLSEMQSAVQSVTIDMHKKYRRSAQMLGERVRRGEFLLEHIGIE
jgi:hypothetical protein